ncbi:MAG: stage V sporulation protein AD [Oscillospiraceae bacterium]|nr:stage V sporulation protein AD [Oscillospiraceae bacterium]
MKCLKNGVVQFDGSAYIGGYASAVGPKENDGRYGGKFDYAADSTDFGETSWEKSETFLQKTAYNIAMNKVGGKEGSDNCEISVLFGGDLLNQCAATSFTMRDIDLPFSGIYGACSTFAQGLLLSGVYLSAVDKTDEQRNVNVAALSSSHFCTAERQFRFPLGYGGQRTPTAQWTATAAGCAVMSTGIIPHGNKNNIHINGGAFGAVRDMAIKDVSNMGAAMAYAAYDSIKKYFGESKTAPDDYDYVVTGDLGLVGVGIIKELFTRDGVDTTNFADCGEMIYDIATQDVHSGGSGCGCSAAIMCAEFFPKLESGEYTRILFGGTGALLSPVTSAQGESIPGICHVVDLGIK